MLNGGAAATALYRLQGALRASPDPLQPLVAFIVHKAIDPIP
jgi:hypothetical protein